MHCLVEILAFFIDRRFKWKQHLWLRYHLGLLIFLRKASQPYRGTCLFAFNAFLVFSGFFSAGVK